MFTYLFPPALPHRRRRMQRMFDLEAARSDERGGTWIAGDGAGAAMWFPPGRWAPTTWEDIRDAPRWVRLFGRQLRRAGRARSAMEAHRPLPGHWYLHYLGVEPREQGTGIGGALLRPVLEECDRTGTPAYLEASCERNRSLYARHGFVQRGAVSLPAGGPTVFPMWREPA
ncbi:GNAT family N-acetyltransferase [Modestobacter altitudinis]|uniref:GNAT family N-acetyltransferase n=1 Tax=Modestobacter altitudinis TaxID=2213158 RepID=UPI0014874632|nr:GNAT family N-acetyltransferase [Modestobacter altitudinis]